MYRQSFNCHASFRCYGQRKSTERAFFPTNGETSLSPCKIKSFYLSLQIYYAFYKGRFATTAPRKALFLQLRAEKICRAVRS